MNPQSLPRPVLVDDRTKSNRNSRSPTKTIPAKYADLQNSRYKNLLKPCPDISETQTKKVYSTTIFSPSSVKTSAAETMASPQSQLTVSVTSPSPNQTKDACSTTKSDKDTKVYTTKALPSSSIGKYQDHTLLHSDSESGQPPHLNSYDALLNYVYTSNPGELIDLLNKNTENIFGILQNIHYLNVEGADKIYTIVLNNLMSSEKLRLVIEDDLWCEGIVPGQFMRILISECKNKIASSDHLIVLKSLFYWARVDKPDLNALGKYICRDGIHFVDLLDEVNFSVIPRDEVLNLLDTMVSDGNNIARTLSEEQGSRVIQKLFEQEQPQSKYEGRKTRRFTNALKAFIGKLRIGKKNFDLERDA